MEDRGEMCVCVCVCVCVVVVVVVVVRRSARGIRLGPGTLCEVFMGSCGRYLSRGVTRLELNSIDNF
jgi:hypothetical protein